jgi:hypothetical protein
MAVPHDDEPITMDLACGLQIELDLAEIGEQKEGEPLRLSPVPAGEMGLIAIKAFGFEAQAPMTKQEIRDLIDHLDEIQGAL